MGTFRFFLAMLVVLEHITFLPRINLGGAAVLAFFLISGYLMPLTLEHAYVRSGSQHLLGGIGRFYLNRALRIYPLYWVSLACILLDYGLLHVFNRADSAVFEPWQLFQNALLITNGWEWLWRHPSNYLNNITWSLNVELQWYLLVPWLVYVFRRSQSVGLAIFGLLLLSPVTGDRSYLAPHSRYFLMGALLYFFVDPRKLSIRHLRWVLGASFAMLVFVVVFRMPSWHAPVLALGATVVSFRQRLVKAGPLDRLLGDLAYPVFVLHGYIANSFVAKVTQYALFTELPRWLQIGIAGSVGMLVSIAAGWIGLRTVVAPVDRLRQRIKRRISP